MKSFDEVLNGALEFAKLTNRRQIVFRFPDGQHSTLGENLAAMQSLNRTLVAVIEPNGTILKEA